MYKLLITIICTLIYINAKAQISKIEPPNWWAGMEHSSVELLLYGNDIGNLTVEATAPLRVTKLEKADNPNYLFVTIETKNLSAGDYTLNVKSGAKIQQTLKYTLEERIPNSKFRQGFDSSDAIYLLMPDRFANGNPKNDNTSYTKEKADRSLPGGRHGGDIRGIINNLDYLEELGMTAIWSTPMCEDDQSVYSYHGYAQTDVYKIDPRFGTNEEYKELSGEMKKRGMKLIKDYVTNHWGIDHWMIQDLPFNDWINEFPEFTRSNYRMTTQFDEYASKNDLNFCVNGWFDTTMPDLNQKNKFLLNYLIQNAIWWIEYADLGGLRVDTYSYCDKKAIAFWTKSIMKEFPNFNIVGEVWMHNQAQIAYWQKDSKIGAIQQYNSYLPSVMDFTLLNAIELAFNENEMHWNNGMVRIYENFVNDFLYADPMNLMIFAENHDTRRINEILNLDLEKYKMVMTLMATTRGIPQFYYGSEIGMSGFKSKGDADIRHDFHGGWREDTQNAFDEKTRTEQQNSYYNFLKKLLNWRKQSKVIHEGKTLQYIPANNLYVFFRMNDEDRVMVIINNSDKNQNIDLGYYTEGIGNNNTGFDIISEKEYSIGTDKFMEIAPQTSLILELKP